jgi:hypothetical protein
MVRLVFRPYTQVRRSICTSEPLRTSTGVSSGFVLLGNSSPSFGSHRIRSASVPSRVISTGRCCSASLRGSHLFHWVEFTFISPLGLTIPLTRVYAKLLGPCFKTGRIGDQLNAERKTQAIKRHHCVTTANACKRLCDAENGEQAIEMSLPFSDVPVKAVER